ncbi:hypothetical protein SCHPADRAFT_373622 [Schizopora paradoxa]|uniref:Fungal-type protein kinase domain-containing protein n=1 Tax=Schizopora paradoxa TaxID=27342 RepID=A0A0H2RNT9_9AGAM|nr:hypothetical protein SCHPADRAFT_373622 [Schizopora paradoxa]
MSPAATPAASFLHLSDTSNLANEDKHSLLFSTLGTKKWDRDDFDFSEWVDESLFDEPDEGQGPNLKNVLGVPIIGNVEGLLGYLFPNSRIGFNSKDLLEKLALRSNGGWQNLPDLRHWVKGPESASKYLGLLTSFTNKILTSLSNGVATGEQAPAQPRSRIRHRWASTGSQGIRPIEKGELACEPTLVLLDESDTTERTQLDWSHVLATFIYKPSDSFKVDAERECVEYAEFIFLAQRSRHFVITACLIETTMTLFYFDRSGGLASSEFNVHEQPESFLRFAMGMLTLNQAGIGFDSSLFFEGDLTFVHVEGKRFELGSRIYSSKGIEGKGTSCFSGKDMKGNVVVIKDSWGDINVAGNEMEILKLLNNPKPDATPDEVKRHEESLCTPDGVRVIPRFVAGENVHVGKTVDEDGCSKMIMTPSTTAPIREALGLLVVDNDEPSKYTWINEKFKGIVLRCQWRIVTSPKGAKFDSASTPTVGDAMLVIHDIIYAIKALRDRNIVHRDICDLNIVVQRHKGMARGLLIDFDSASDVHRVIGEARSERRGTLEFMTLDRLVPDVTNPHTYFHDLQSLFFVLCWFCTVPKACQRCACGGNVKHGDTIRTRWSGFDYSPSTLQSVLKAKMNDVLSEENFEKKVLKNFHPCYNFLKESVRYCRRVLFGDLDYSALARPYLMTEILKSDVTLLQVCRLANLLPPSERSPTVVSMSMAESLYPQELPGVTYKESVYDALIAKAIREQTFRLFAMPNQSIVAKLVENKLIERRLAKSSRSKDGKDGEIQFSEDDSDGDDEITLEDVAGAFDDRSNDFVNDLETCVKARLSEAIGTMVEEYPEFVLCTSSDEIFNKIRGMIEGYESTLNAFSDEGDARA